MIKDTLYATYIKDREGLEVLENETSFVTYKINGEECFIKDMSVDSSLRKSGLGRTLISDLSGIAQKAGCKFISANIDLADKGANNTLIAALMVGFKVENAQNRILLIVKSLED